MRVRVGVAVAVTVAVGVGVLVVVPVGVAVAVSVAVAVTVPVNVGSLLQNPVLVRSIQRFHPAEQLSATPAEQSASVLNRTMVPEQVVWQTVAHSCSELIDPLPQQPAEEQLPHGVQSHEHTQHTPCATGTEPTVARVATAATHSATQPLRKVACRGTCRSLLKPIRLSPRRNPTVPPIIRRNH